MSATVQDIILLLGDSLTQGASAPYGFAQQLSYVYNRKLDVLNRGLSGYNTTWALPVFEQCVAKRSDRAGLPTIRLLIIWFGANDGTLPGTLQHVPLPLFTENLTKMIHLVSSPSSDYHSPETKIILLTPPPVNTHQRAADLATRTPPRPVDRDFNVTVQYAEAVRALGKKEGVPVVDVHTRLWEGCGKEEKNLTKYLRDGLHVNEEAYRLIFEDIMATIKEYYPELDHEKLEMVFPHYADINHENVAAAVQKKAIF
ncbi:hypothetical protein NM688_g5935 [Phlebia brevispora]|uniref:Uncharacterized protein n=1 Tax=Phlebia brevispora TaxID=194682 RepID=A0ACC1SMP6_9APHY|nr:hypothetical protein NM688_g5935 [Phlebia brevispora]